MISTIRISMVLVASFMVASMALAQSSDTPRDARAIEVIESLSAYSDKLDQLVIRGTSFTDARLEAGLMVSNAAETELIIDRPGSLYISSIAGGDKQEIYFHEGLLSVFNSRDKFYAQASIPMEIEAAVNFAMDEMDIDAPFLDLIYRDVGGQLADSQDAVHYLTDKSRVDGVDCHHIAVRGPEVDLQLWVTEGDKPVLKKIIITSKWEGGSPRFVGNMQWDTAPRIDSNSFEFKPPEGSTNIGFASDAAKP